MNHAVQRYLTLKHSCSRPCPGPATLRCWRSAPVWRHLRTFSTPAIRGIQNFDANVVLDDEVEKELFSILGSEAFCEQVSRECGVDGVRLEFTGHVFQPVPWSPNTTKGMPKEFEQYHDDQQHVIINVPPTMLFRCKVMKPSRLCAVFKRA